MLFPTFEQNRGQVGLGELGGYGRQLFSHLLYDLAAYNTKARLQFRPSLRVHELGVELVSGVDDVTAEEQRPGGPDPDI